MKYSNAYSGVKKFFVSEVLNVIASVIYLAETLFYLLVGSKSVSADTAIFTFSLMFIGGIVGLIAFILQIAGLSQARKDEPLFKTAFTFVIVGIICTVIATVTAGTFSNIFSGANEVVTLLVSVYLILGVYSLALKFDDKAVQRSGKLTTIVASAVFAIAVAAEIIGIFTPAVNNVFDTVCAALNLFGYAVFLTYLARAKKMFVK